MKLVRLSAGVDVLATAALDPLLDELAGGRDASGADLAY